VKSAKIMGTISNHKSFLVRLGVWFGLVWFGLMSFPQILLVYQIEEAVRQYLAETFLLI
jgi:hypothetical protein